MEPSDVLRWLDTFLRSPGLGGLAAVGAAWVGFGQWRRQARVDAETRRERAAVELRSRQDEQWWEVYRLSHGARPVTPGMASDEDELLLRALLATAETEIQVAAAAAMLTAYGAGRPDRDEEETPDDD